MSRYDFIRFGGFVNWADEDTDTFRKMKVCLPVKEPVEDDTKIGLISTDEDNPEEIAVSYSGRAAELIPWTDSFQEGYWKALIVAEANGAGTDVLLPMLKDAGLCLMECVFLMLRSDACKLFPVLCRLFPEVEEMFEIITWNDREYFVRELTLFRGTGGEYKTLVSVTGLQDVLVGKDGAPISDEAEAVDRKICYYFTDEEFLLPEERLVALAEDA